MKYMSNNMRTFYSYKFSSYVYYVVIVYLLVPGKRNILNILYNSIMTGQPKKYQVILCLPCNFCVPATVMFGKPSAASWF